MLKKWIGFTICILIVSSILGCSSVSEELERIDSLQFDDTKYDVETRYVMSRGNLARAGSVYYVNKGYLWYYDDETDTMGKLCGKAECMHDSMTCNAYTGARAVGGVQIYDGKLYFMRGNTIVCTDFAGNNLENVMMLPVGNATLSNPEWVIHRGELFFRKNEHIVDRANPRKDLKITRQQLGDYTNVESVFEVIDSTAWGDWMLRGDQMFIDLSYGAWGKREFYMYDLNTREIITLIDEKFNGYIVDYQVDDESFTFLGRTLDETYILKYDLKSKKNTKIFKRKESDMDFSSQMSNDGKWILIYDTQETMVKGQPTLYCDVYSIDYSKTPHNTCKIIV